MADWDASILLVRWQIVLVKMGYNIYSVQGIDILGFLGLYNLYVSGKIKTNGIQQRKVK